MYTSKSLYVEKETSFKNNILVIRHKSFQFTLIFNAYTYEVAELGKK